MQDLCKRLTKRLIIYSHDFHVGTCRVRERAEDVKDCADPEFSADRSDIFHRNMIILGKEENQVNFLKNFLRFLRLQSDIDAQRLETVGCTGLAGCSTVSMLGDRYSLCCNDDR